MPAIAGAALVCLAWTTAAGADTFTVNKRGDHAPGACTANDCTLREAVIAGNTNLGEADRVVVPSRRTYTLTIPDAGDGAMSGDLDVTNDRLTVMHPGKGRARIDQQATDRVFAALAPLTVSKLEITGGEAFILGHHYGGGIYATANLRVERSVVSDNAAVACGGGIHTELGANLGLLRSRVAGNRAGSQGGGVSASCIGNAGKLTMARSTISGNRSDTDDNGGGYGGGMYLQVQPSSTRSTIRDSTFAGNNSGPQPSSDGGGLYTDLGRLSVSGSTFSGNRTGGAGGGIHVTGTEPFKIVNSTVSGNRAKETGGGVNLDSGTVAMNATTVVRNLGNSDGSLNPEGGGIATDDDPFVVRNSLIALNRRGSPIVGEPPVKNDCTGAVPFQSRGHNLLSTFSSCEGFDQQGDSRRANPKIGKLRRNGGPTKTVALKRRSPAIGEAKRSSAPKRDQRGRKRDKRPDIGAFER